MPSTLASRLLLSALLLGTFVDTNAQSGAPRPPVPECAGIASLVERQDCERGFFNDVRPYEDYDKKQRDAQQVSPLTSSLFGDEVNLSNGTTAFSVVDIDLPGNNPIPVQLRRTFAVESKRGTRPLSGFGSWDLDIPYLVGTFASSSGWPANRCNAMWVPPSVGGHDGSNFWAGTMLHLPGQGDQELLWLHSTLAHPVPSSGGPYKWISRGDIRYSCTAIDGTHSRSTVTGEGFVAHLPDGSTYTLNVGYEVDHGSLRIGSDSLPRKRTYLMPSRVVDRFGNGVTYRWSIPSPNSNPELNEIEGDDGRKIVLTWSNGQIVTATAHGRSWSYGYVGTLGEPPYSVPWLSSVATNDNSYTPAVTSTWTYTKSAGDLVPLYPTPDVKNDANCTPPEQAFSTFVLTATHPSGAKGEFTFNYQRHDRIVTEPACTNNGNGWVLSIPTYFDIFALTQKKLMGLQPESAPLLVTPTQTTTYSYNWFCPSCSNSKQTLVDQPDGSQVIYEFGARHNDNDGRLLKTITKDAPNGVVLRQVESVYMADADPRPFPDVYGLNSGTQDTTSRRIRPIKQTIVTQQGETFAYEATAFDVYARPTGVTRSSTAGPGYSRSETRKYNNNIAKWVVGQLEHVANSTAPATCLDAPTTTPECVVYDDTTALPTHRYSFGKLQQRTSYHTSGNQAGLPHEVFDGGNVKKTTLTDYHRGIPQLVTYHDSTEERVSVTDRGNIEWIQDTFDNRTCYEYDDWGRIKKVIHPSESEPEVCNETTWKATTVSFRPLTSAQHQIPAGHWRRTETTDTRVTETYFDALWRPILTRQSSTDGSAGVRATRKKFDQANREVFSSYATSTFSSFDDFAVGIETDYDALGRVTSTLQDSEQGMLSTTTTYASNAFETTFTDARGKSTTTTYQAFDQPTFDFPMTISAPEGQTTSFERDVYGKPMSMTRSGEWPGATCGLTPGVLCATRYYAYDNHQRLCKTKEPDAGIRILAYDASGNIAWRANGLVGGSFDSPTACQSDEVTAIEKSTHHYDARNRLVAIDHPAGTEDVGYSYFGDGHLHTATTGTLTSFNPPVWSTKTSEWTYAYNKRRLLTTETLALPPEGKTYTASWTFNARGDTAGLSYPSSLGITFDPNAYGEPRQVGNLATGATYHPNGQFSGYSYGNGTVRTVTLNDRRLPWQTTDVRSGVTLFDHTLLYDENGNVKEITDTVVNAGLGNTESRKLYYDDRNRLEFVDAVPYGSTDETYVYDPLDNVRTTTLGGVERRYVYPASTQRLQQITNASNVVLNSYQWNDLGELDHRTIAGIGEDLTFDRAHRMTLAPDGSTHRYDAHNRRVKTAVAGGNPRYQFYSRSGALLFVQEQLNSTDHDNFDYFHLGATLVAHRKTNSNDKGKIGIRHYYHSDHRGSPSAKSQASGTIVERSRLKPYGDPYDGIWRDGPGFTKHATDQAAKLVYMQQRYFDPAMLGFLSPDPDSAHAQSFNVYWYANGNPHTFVDPDGRRALSNLCSRAGATSCPGSYLSSTLVTETYVPSGAGPAPSPSPASATLPRGQSRPLTAGEVSMSRSVFGSGINYSSPRVFRRTFFPVGQRRGVAVAPNGNIYFHPDDYVDDFSSGGVATRAWFMHEMTHVWQHQNGINVLIRGSLNRNYNYLPLVPGKSFRDYGVEQQGDIVRHYYLLMEGHSVPGAPNISVYQNLVPF